MKDSTFFIIKKFNCKSVEVSECSGSITGNVSKEMESAVYSPSAHTIRKILDFARAYNVVETKTTGHVEMNLN
jgi:hypothetical protein